MPRPYERSTSAYCKNNLRQLALAMRQYCDDNDGYFPAIPDDMSEAGALYPHELMCETMGLTEGPFPSDPARMPKVVMCPACEITAADGPDHVYRHFAWNAHLNSYEPMSAGESRRLTVTRADLGLPATGPVWSQLGNDAASAIFRVRRIDQIVDPSHVMVFMDSNDVDPTHTPEQLYQWRMTVQQAVQGMVPNRHSNGGNVVFVDGHVEWREASQLVLPNEMRQWFCGSDLNDDAVWHAVP